MMGKTTLYLRADGNSTIGLGHLFRLFAVADMVKKDFDCYLLSKNLPKSIRSIAQTKCTKIIDIPSFDTETEEVDFLIKTHLNTGFLIVLDGYQFRTTYQQKLKAAGGTLVYIDDLQDFFIPSDVVINHAGGVQQNNYNISKATKLYLGPKYALLQKAFLDAETQPKKMKKEVGFVCFGGADPNNITEQVLQNILPNVTNVNVVIGGVNLHRNRLENLASTQANIQLYSNLSATQMIDLMQTSDFAVCAASTIAYEIATINLPLFLLQTADNQQGIYQFFIKNNLALPFEAFDLYQNFTPMLEQQAAFFDKKSGKRILEIFRKIKIKK